MKTKLKEPILKHIFFISLYLSSVIWSLSYSFSIDHLDPSFLELGFLLLSGYFLADLLTGISHFLLDNWPLRYLEPYLEKVSSLEEIPQDVLKKSSVFSKMGLDFRLHHKHMNDILLATPEYLLFRILEGVAIYIPLMSLLNYFIFHSSFFGYITILSSFFVLFGQYAHKWAHTQNNHKIIKFLQKTGFIISVKKHAQHHLDTRYNYSLLNGWSNFLINGGVRMGIMRANQG